MPGTHHGRVAPWGCLWVQRRVAFVVPNPWLATMCSSRSLIRAADTRERDTRERGTRPAKTTQG